MAMKRDDRDDANRTTLYQKKRSESKKRAQSLKPSEKSMIIKKVAEELTRRTEIAD